MYLTKVGNALISDALPPPIVDKRDDCTSDGCENMPVSTWQKTGIPVIIGVVLFIIVFVVLFVIVRKRRQQTRKEEEAAQAKIDMDDVEDRAQFQATRKE